MHLPTTPTQPPRSHHAASLFLFSHIQHNPHSPTQYYISLLITLPPAYPLWRHDGMSLMHHPLVWAIKGFFLEAWNECTTTHSPYCCYTRCMFPLTTPFFSPSVSCIQKQMMLLLISTSVTLASKWLKEQVFWMADYVLTIEQQLLEYDSILS